MWRLLLNINKKEKLMCEKIKIVLSILLISSIICSILLFVSIQKLKNERDYAVKFRECLMAKKKSEKCKNMIASERFAMIIGEYYSTIK